MSITLAVCHANCETCTGPGADECSTCKAGFREEKSGEGDDAKMSCVDINECVEQSGICPVGKYCANTEGSYSCEGKKLSYFVCSSIVFWYFLTVISFCWFVLSYVLSK